MKSLSEVLKRLSELEAENKMQDGANGHVIDGKISALRYVLELDQPIKDKSSLIRIRTSGGTVPFGKDFYKKRPVEIMTIAEAMSLNWSWTLEDWSPEFATRFNSIVGEEVFLTTEG